MTGAIKGLGNDVFKQLTSWVAEGASWLMGQVVKAIDSSTTPRLDTEGFLRAYWRMAAIAAVLAAAMLLLAILEGIAQGSPGLLARVLLLNVPLAFLGTSLAFAVVQLLISCTDGLSAAIANATHHDSTRFFEAAIGDLGHVGGQAGKQLGSAGGSAPSEGLGTQAAGAVAMPLFVGFLAAIVGAFAAFFVWLELLMRDAAVYAVSLFMPLALAGSIWPRWTGALRRTGELLVALIGSKFVIVAIVSLAASLVVEEGSSVEHVLAAAALMCLACFAPFVLLRLIPFSEGALAAAYGRRSSAGGAVSAVQIGSDVQILRNMGRSGGRLGGDAVERCRGRRRLGRSRGRRPRAGPPGRRRAWPGPRRSRRRPGGRGTRRGGGRCRGGRGGGWRAGGCRCGGPGGGGAGGEGRGGAPGGNRERAGTGGLGRRGAGGEPGAGGGSVAKPGSQSEASTKTGGAEAGGSPPAAGERPPRPAPESPRSKGEDAGGKR